MIPADLSALGVRHGLDVRGSASRWGLFSSDDRYRYLLAVEVDPDSPSVLAMCGLNPSEATEIVNDHTFTKCQHWARTWGFGWLWMVNAFAVRGKKPTVITKVPDPVGPANDEILCYAAGHAQKFVCCWGAHAKHLARGARIKRELAAAGVALWCFGLNTDGSPEHPLMLPYDRQLVAFGDGAR